MNANDCCEVIAKALPARGGLLASLNHAVSESAAFDHVLRDMSMMLRDAIFTAEYRTYAYLVRQREQRTALGRKLAKAKSVGELATLARDNARIPRGASKLLRAEILSAVNWKRVGHDVMAA
jgi:hypothetical protein